MKTYRRARAAKHGLGGPPLAARRGSGMDGDGGPALKDLAETERDRTFSSPELVHIDATGPAARACSLGLLFFCFPPPWSLVASPLRKSYVESRTAQKRDGIFTNVPITGREQRRACHGS